MDFTEIKIRLGLVSIRRILTSGDYSKGFQKALSLSQKFPRDERVLTVVADASLFLRNCTVSQEYYDRVISLLDVDTPLSKDNKRFLRAYISFRKLELDFLQDNQKPVAKSHLVEDINNIPAGSGLKTLFFIKANHPYTPRPYGYRSVQETIRLHLS